MWLWWIMSVVLLILTIAFAFRTLASSRSLHRLILFGDNSRLTVPSGRFRNFANLITSNGNDELSALQTKIRLLEKYSSDYRYQLSKMKERVEALEQGTQLSSKKTKAEGENWEELYYEALDKRQKLEDELDALKYPSEKCDPYQNVISTGDHINEVSILRSTVENQSNDMMNLQNMIGELQQQVEGSHDREKFLREQLDAEKNTRYELKHVKQQYSRAQSEADELRSRISEISERDQQLQKKIHELSELESRIDNSEFEKAELRKSVEDIILENKTLSAKLADLQDKLGAFKPV